MPRDLESRANDRPWRPLTSILSSLSRTRARSDLHTANARNKKQYKCAPREMRARAIDSLVCVMMACNFVMNIVLPAPIRLYRITRSRAFIRGWRRAIVAQANYQSLLRTERNSLDPVTNDRNNKTIHSSSRWRFSWHSRVTTALAEVALACIHSVGSVYRLSKVCHPLRAAAFIYASEFIFRDGVTGTVRFFLSSSGFRIHEGC